MARPPPELRDGEVRHGGLNPVTMLPAGREEATREGYAVVEMSPVYPDPPDPLRNVPRICTG